MKILTFYKNISQLFLIGFFTSFSWSQTTKPKITQDPRFEQLLNEKRKINSTLNQNEGFKIQIFTGENEAAKKTLTEFRKANQNIDATIVFHTPIYKVWVGNFKTRIEAEKKVKQLQKKYSNAFLIKAKN